MQTDKLNQILGDTKNSKRRDTWLWFKLNEYGCKLPPLTDTTPSPREVMAGRLETSPQLIDRIKYDQNFLLLPDESFSWINEGKRQIEWIKSNVSRVTHHNWMINPANLNGVDLIKFIIDIWSADLTQKQFILDGARAQWEQHKKEDIAFKWFKDDNQKSALAWKLLKIYAPIQMGFKQPFEDYDDLLIFFDTAELSREQIELYIEKIKKRWSQQKYREKTNGKSQCNLMISDKSIEILNNLSHFHEISRARVVELLLEMEAIKGNYIAERVKLQKLLNSDLPQLQPFPKPAQPE